MQRGLGEAVPPKGVPPMSNCRGFPHSRKAWLTAMLCASGGNPQDRAASRQRIWSEPLDNNRSET
ncbi:MAG: hypothetical protein F6K55_14245 [Moorea sp. SIO4A3]|nr:hypothetical protein [Moorena sp. SIO4A3]